MKIAYLEVLWFARDEDARTDLAPALADLGIQLHSLSTPWHPDRAQVSAVARVEADLMPMQLKQRLKKIETDGRFRFHLLLFARITADSEWLQLPHPRLKEKDELLKRVLELDPHAKDPVTGKPYARTARG